MSETTAIGACPECGYTFTRYARILGHAPYTPGDPCPECGEQADLLTLGDDPHHLANLLQALDGNNVSLEPFQHPHPPQTHLRALQPGSLWRNRGGLLFARIERCRGKVVEVTIDPNHTLGRSRKNLNVDDFLDTFDCVAFPNDP